MTRARKAKAPVEEADELAGPPPERLACSQITAKGKACKGRVILGTDPPLCSSHLGKVGRPSKLDDVAVDRMVEILKNGGYVEAASAAAGVAKQTFYNWLHAGDPEGTRKADEPYREFRRRIEQARAEGEARNVLLIARAANKDWKAAAWMLERQFPERWAGPRGRSINSSIHPDDFAAGEMSSGPDVADDQVGPDGRPL